MAKRAADDEHDALAQAQDLIFDAYEAETRAARLDIARRALAISPLCADAHALLAEHARRGSKVELEHWRQALAAGRQALGDSFDELAGEFWGFLETRPYMRARLGLATALWERGEREEAVDHMQDMLRLNPGDNQGVRYILVESLFSLGRDEAAAALLESYAEDDMAHWRWATALASFRRHGDGAESRAALKAAIAGNRHVAGYLLAEQAMPRTAPAYFSPGEKSEAICYVGEAIRGWRETAGALDWLRARRPAPKPRKAPTPRGTAV